MYKIKLLIVMSAVVASTLLTTRQMSPNPKTNKKPTTNPIKYLHQYLTDWDILSAHPLRMHGEKMPVRYGYTAPPSWGRRG